ncbi:30S ribosomal protein S6 [Candidatus Parcubacteria bacterium]|nr:30S ribosomal protein S6 [Candidatus Parcubacteria bacterium]
MSTTEDHKESQVYELGYLILPSIAEDSLSDVVNALKGIISKVGGTELDSEMPIKIDLAYTMSKVTGARKYVVDDAYIGWVKFECEPSCINEIDTAVKQLDEVLRHLLVKTTKETHFTFAEALKKQEEAEEAKLEGDKPAEAPVEPVVQ